MFLILAALLARWQSGDSTPPGETRNVDDALAELPACVNAVAVARAPLARISPQNPFNFMLPYLRVVSKQRYIQAHVRLIVSGTVAKDMTSPYPPWASQSRQGWGWHCEWCCLVFLDVPDLDFRDPDWPEDGANRLVRLNMAHPRPYVYVFSTSKALLNAPRGPDLSRGQLRVVNLASRMWAVSWNTGLTACSLNRDGRLSVSHLGPSSRRVVPWRSLADPVYRECTLSWTWKDGHTSDTDMSFEAPDDWKSCLLLIYSISPDFGLFPEPI